MEFIEVCQGRQVLHSIEKELSIQMVDFVLIDDRLETGDLNSCRLSFAIERTDSDPLPPLDHPSDVFDGETAFPPGLEVLRNGHDPAGKHVVVCGRSVIVGKPVAMLLAQKREGANATVTVCHTGTSDLANITRQADILIVAMGSPRVIKANMVKPGAVVIDVGLSRVDDSARPRGYRLDGDVDFEAVSEVAEAITPVPGGVGPMTVAMLLVNTLKAAQAIMEG